MENSIRRLIAVGAALLVIGCSQSPDVQTSSPAPVVTETSTAEPPSQTTEPTSTVANTEAPAPLEPWVKGSFIAPLDWSPDSQWFAYAITHDDDIFLPNEIEFASPVSDQVCRVKVTTVSDPPYEYKFSGAWLPDGQFLTAGNGVVQLGKPCETFSDISSRFIYPPLYVVSSSLQGTILLKTENGFALYDGQTGAINDVNPEVDGFSLNYGWSPHGLYLAISGMVSVEPEFSGYTWVVDARTGDLVEKRQWSVFYHESPAHQPVWIDSSHYLIPHTERGPVIGKLGGGVQDVASEIFGFELAEECPQVPCYRNGDAYGIPQANSENYALIFVGHSAHPNIEDRWYVTYSESGVIEELSAPAMEGASPDGRWVILEDYDAVRDKRVDDYWLRSIKVDIPQVMELFDIPTYVIRASWSPDSQRLAFLTDNGIQVMNILDGIVVGAWMPKGDWLFWSPDGRWLAYRNGYSPGDSSSLFLLEP